MARDHRLDRNVAVKLVAVGTGADAERRFERACRAAARVQHPHVVPIFGFGTLASGASYVIMEYLRGEDLGQRLAREGRLAVADCAALVDQLARALAAIHHAGLLHRDINPANIVLVEGFAPLFAKVVGFGVAKPTRPADAGPPTSPGTLVGTVAYTSPEQLVEGTEETRRADCWALAVVTYQCLTGALPFEATTIAALGRRLDEGGCRRPSDLCPGLPARLDTVFGRALAVDQNVRPDDPIEFAQAFREALGDRATGRAGGAAMGSPRQGPSPLPPAPRAGMVVAPPTRRSAVHALAWRIAAMGSLGLLLVAGGLSQLVSPTGVKTLEAFPLAPQRLAPQGELRATMPTSAARRTEAAPTKQRARPPAGDRRPPARPSERPAPPRPPARRRRRAAPKQPAEARPPKAPVRAPMTMPSLRPIDQADPWER